MHFSRYYLLLCSFTVNGWQTRQFSVGIRRRRPSQPCRSETRIGPDSGEHALHAKSRDKMKTYITCRLGTGTVGKSSRS